MRFTSSSLIIKRVSSQWKRGGVFWSPCRRCARMWTFRRLSRSECRRRSSLSVLLIQLDLSPTALELRDPALLMIGSLVRQRLGKIFVTLTSGLPPLNNYVQVYSTGRWSKVSLVHSQWTFSRIST